jgi:hypothetical protein
MTPTFRSWLLAAAAGDTYIYHTGNLAEDRYSDPALAPWDAAEELDELAAEVWQASEAGLVLLTQRRMREEGHALSAFAYLATRTSEMVA